LKNRLLISNYDCAVFDTNSKLIKLYSGLLTPSQELSSSNTSSNNLTLINTQDKKLVFSGCFWLDLWSPTIIYVEKCDRSKIKVRVGDVIVLE